VTAYTVTATQGGNTYNVLVLSVLVLTGAAAATSQPGATAIDSTASNMHVTLTPTTTGSLVVGANESDSGSGGGSAESGTTILELYLDTVNEEYYGTFRATNTTTSLTATVYGMTGTEAGACDCVAVEILPSGTIAVDSSSPAAVPTDSAITVTTASFSPPAASLLVALIGSDGYGANPSGTTMSVTSSPALTWTEMKHSEVYCYAGVWVAQVPGSGPSAAVVPPERPHFVPQAVSRASNW
jgi:hypothetical protein